MTKGRKKLPTEIKQIKGTYRKGREIKDQVVSRLVVDFPDPPDYINKYAVDVWNKTIAELRQMGVLAKIDMDLITAYCIEMGRYNEANDIITKNGSPLTKAPSGYPMIHPWYTVARQSLKSALEIGCNFGITAAARTKIAVPDKGESKLKQLLKSKPA